MSLSLSLWDFENEQDPAIREIVSEEQQKLPGTFLDFGPPLPSRYGVDRLELMLQSPLRVFAYWEVSEATILKALRNVPIQDRGNFQLVLRWCEEDAGRERWLDPGTTDNWWFDTIPESRYRLELGLFWNEYGWLPLLASNAVVTPRLALGPASVGEPPQTQVLLQNLVQQAGIGLPQDVTQSRSAADKEPEAREPVVGDTLSGTHLETPTSEGQHPPSGLRPTSRLSRDWTSLRPLIERS